MSNEISSDYYIFDFDHEAPNLGGALTNIEEEEDRIAAALLLIGVTTLAKITDGFFVDLLERVSGEEFNRSSEVADYLCVIFTKTEIQNFGYMMQANHGDNDDMKIITSSLKEMETRMAELVESGMPLLEVMAVLEEEFGEQVKEMRRNASK